MIHFAHNAFVPVLTGRGDRDFAENDLVDIFHQDWEHGDVVLRARIVALQQNDRAKVEVAAGPNKGVKASVALADCNHVQDEEAVS